MTNRKLRGNNKPTNLGSASCFIKSVDFSIKRSLFNVLSSNLETSPKVQLLNTISLSLSLFTNQFNLDVKKPKDILLNTGLVNKSQKTR